MSPWGVELGAFSVSLSVKDLAASKAFYGALGFEQVGGNAQQGWLVLRNGGTTIGLFAGMFEGNILTFNPGWDAQAKPLASFTDIRTLHGRIAAAGLAPAQEAGLAQDGPASFVLTDPDGNAILVDQHVPKA